MRVFAYMKSKFYYKYSEIKWEVKFISTIHTADIVVTEKKN